MITGTPDAGGVVGTSSTYDVAFADDAAVAAFVGGLTDASVDFAVNGAPIDLSAVTTVGGFIAAFTAGSGVTASAVAGGLRLTSDDHAAALIAVTGATGTAAAGTADVVPFGGIRTTLLGQLDLTYTGGVITLGSGAGFDLATVQFTSGQNATDRATVLRSALESAFSGVDVTVSDSGALAMRAQVPAATAFTVLVAGPDAALDAIDAAIQTVSGVRADIGAVQNLFERIIVGLTSYSDALTAARSRVRDVDMAAEMVILTRAQITAGVSTAMLAQANSSSQDLVQLLRG